MTISLSNLLLLIFDICVLGLAFWMRNNVVATLELATTIWINNVSVVFIHRYKKSKWLKKEKKLNKLLDNIMGNKFLIFWTLVPTFVSIFQIIGSNFDGRKFNQDAAYGIMCLCLAILFISVCWYETNKNYNFIKLKIRIRDIIKIKIVIISIKCHQILQSPTIFPKINHKILIIKYNIIFPKF